MNKVNNALCCFAMRTKINSFLCALELTYVVLKRLHTELQEPT